MRFSAMSAIQLAIPSERRIVRTATKTVQSVTLPPPNGMRVSSMNPIACPRMPKNCKTTRIQKPIRKSRFTPDVSTFVPKRRLAN